MIGLSILKLILLIYVISYGLTEYFNINYIYFKMSAKNVVVLIGLVMTIKGKRLGWLLVSSALFYSVFYFGLRQIGDQGTLELVELIAPILDVVFLLYLYLGVDFKGIIGEKRVRWIPILAGIIILSVEWMLLFFIRS